MTKVILNNKAVDFDAAVNLMDDDIRETLHDMADGWGEQEFLDAYVKAHTEVHGEEFAV